MSFGYLHVFPIAMVSFIIFFLEGKHKAGEKTKAAAGQLLLVCALLMSLCLCAGWSAANAAETTDTSNNTSESKISLCLNAPSDAEQVIAPGRHFKVSGSIEGVIADDAVVRVSLYDVNGNEVRYAEADRKGIDLVDTSWYKGQILNLAGDTDLSEIAYTMPEMVNRRADSETACHNATVKCIYTDTTFYALITAATNTDFGLSCDDFMNLVDENGDPYTVLPESSYKVIVTVTENGEKIAETSKDITIGTTNGTVILRGGSAQSRKIMMQWAVDNNYTVLEDLLPGMFGPFYQMTAIPVSYMCEKAEYETGKIAVMNYNITADSTSYSLELANFVQKAGIADDADLVEYYLFDIGEPAIGDRIGSLIKTDNSKIYLCRADVVTDEAQDGIFYTNGSRIKSSVFDLNNSKAITVASGDRIALMGATNPYQLKEDEVTVDPDRYGFCIYSNGIATLKYTFKASDGTAIKATKDIGLVRINDRTAAYKSSTKGSVLEFYHVFDTNGLQSGEYKVTVVGFDRFGQAIPNMETEFTLTVQ